MLIAVLLGVSIVAVSATIALAGQPSSNHGAEVSAVAKAVENVVDGSHGLAVREIARQHGAEVSAAARAKGQANAAAGRAHGAAASESGRLKAASHQDSDEG
jgi:hypothetical protein